jgi:DNA-binding NtrC family response regulator
LDVITIRLPPLRERREDIPLLAQHLLTRYGQQNNKTITGFSRAALDRLVDYPWPGNVREDLPEWIVGMSPGQRAIAIPLGTPLEEAERRRIEEIVVYCRTGVRASHDYFVLRLLGYPRVRLYDGSFLEWSADPTLPVAR